jgi:flagellar export protein FliJ
MAYRFPLATVLRVKEIIEKREEVALQKAELEIARTGRRIHEITEQIATASRFRDNELRLSIKANRLLVLQAEINAANEAKETLIASMQTLRQQRDVQMKQYQNAHSEREMFADLHKQRKSAYELEQTRVQQKRLDDIVASRWQRS